MSVENFTAYLFNSCQYFSLEQSGGPTDLLTFHRVATNMAK